MKVDKLHVFLVAASLLAAGCASQPTQAPQSAVASAPGAPTGAASTAASAKPAAAASGGGTSTQPATTSSSDSTGQFKKVERDGKTFYCDHNPRTGSRMSKPYCLNEDQYAAWKEQNDALKDEIRRNSNPINTSNRDPGPR
jgi:hypothetical protein